jgi:hypothetical protein
VKRVNSLLKDIKGKELKDHQAYSLGALIEAELDDVLPFLNLESSLN